MKAGASSTYLTAWHARKRPADAPAPRPAMADLHKLLEIGSNWHFIGQLLPIRHIFHGLFGPLTPSPDCAWIVCDWIFDIPTASRLSLLARCAFICFQQLYIISFYVTANPFDLHLPDHMVYRIYKIPIFYSYITYYRYNHERSSDNQKPPPKC